MAAKPKRPRNAMPVAETKRERVEIRRIENGYIARHTSSSPAGEYRERETWLAKLPAGMMEHLEGKPMTKEKAKPRET